LTEPEEGVIRARRIELVDANGDARVLIDGEGLVDGFVGIVVTGEDGPVSSFTLGVGGSVPYLHMVYGGATATVTFGADGSPMVNVRDAGGEDHRITTD
jgi:hypothetical protein